MTNEQQEQLNQLYQQAFKTTLKEGDNITLDMVGEFVREYFYFEQMELDEKEFINVLRG